MEIRVYDLPTADTGFETRLVTQKESGVRITEEVRKVGSFEITYPLDAYGSDEFQQHRMVLIDKYYCGIIEDMTRTAGQEGTNLTIRGKDLKTFLESRIVLPAQYQAPSALAGYDAVNGSTETCIKHYWNNNIASSPYASRRIQGFTIAPDLGRGLPNDKYKARHNVLSDVTSELAEEPKLIVTANADLQGGIFVFDVADAPIHTYGSNSPMVFTIENGNVASMEYQNLLSTGYNLFYATRSGDQYADEALTLMYYREDEPGEPAGVARREKHINVSSDTPFPGQEYTEMRRQALHDMENYTFTQSFIAAINPTKAVYRKDYNLGDIVTVVNLDWGVTLDAQITSVTITADGNSANYDVTFGERKPSIFKRLERDINNI